MFDEIATNHEFGIDEMEVVDDYVHILLSFPPRYGIAIVVGMMKSISASVIFKEHPEVKMELWGGEFWEDGYFVRTVGDEVAAETIRKYIEYHRGDEKRPSQMTLFYMPRLIIRLLLSNMSVIRLNPMV